MKVIVSRKGFDSAAGGVPSPILPDGRIVSLPIPDARSPVRYGDIGGGGRDIARLVSNLTGGRLRRSSRAHLDPDLLASDRPRLAGWRPVFGQEGAAQGHLRNEGVGTGDLFVFFGLYQRVILRRGRFVFDRTAPRIHLLWGWLQVDRVVPTAGCPEAIRRWAGEHPHFFHPSGPGNVIYLGRDRLRTAEGTELPLPGSGVFTRFRRLLQLTDQRSTRPSLWRLPSWMWPPSTAEAPSYHRNAGRWCREGGITRLQSAARGQEFVVSTEQYPELMPCLAALIGRFGCPGQPGR